VRFGLDVPERVSTAYPPDARLLLLETGSEREGTMVELVHESLIERWAKLGQWLTKSEQDAQFLDRLRVAAQQWEKSKEAEGLLWRDRAAEEARAWLKRRRCTAARALSRHVDASLATGSRPTPLRHAALATLRWG
jgi:hypothetical protein